jgi:hypothetical protein
VSGFASQPLKRTGTHLHWEHVYQSYYDDERSNPHCRINILAGYPLEDSSPIIVFELEDIGDSHKLVGGNRGIGKPMCC